MPKPNTGLFGGPVPQAPKTEDGPRQGPFEEKQVRKSGIVPVGAAILMIVAAIMVIAYLSR